MDVSAFIAAGFLGLAPGGFGGAGPIPLGAPTYDDINTIGVWLQPTESPASAAPAGTTFTKFSATDFPFVRTIPDDGEGKAGGWQVAKVNLEFISIVVPSSVTKWYCPFKIQMPLRTEFMGKVDAKRAAKMSVEITNSVGPGMDHKLPQGIFCERFILLTRATFKVIYPFLGSSVTK